MGLLGVAWSNIIIGLASAILVGFVTQAKDKIWNAYLERKFPVEGEYLTTFEDEDDDGSFVATAPARLKQSGREIKGRTKMPGHEREWKLEGEISTDGYLNGIYYAVDPHDQGVGNFFLYINHDRHMEGLWSGYDEANEKISSGKYTFTPMFDAFDIEPLQEEWIPAVVDIADQRLGKDYLDTDLVTSSLDPDSDYFTRVAVVQSSFESNESLANRLASRLLDEGPETTSLEEIESDALESKVVGYCVGAVFDESELLNYLNVEKNALPAALVHADNIGVIRTVSVREGFESQGIGTSLVNECIEECLKRDATALCAVGWREDGNVNIGGVMDYFDFKPAEEYDEYWYEESERLDYYCDSCGSSPCTCPAVLFTRYL